MNRFILQEYGNKKKYRYTRVQITELQKYNYKLQITDIQIYRLKNTHVKITEIQTTEVHKYNLQDYRKNMLN